MSFINFKECYTRVQNYIGDTSSGTLAIIKETIQLKTNDLLQRGFWRFAIRNTSITTTANTSGYYLPNDCDRILDVRQTSSPVQLTRILIEDYDRVVPNPTTPGKPLRYMELQEDRVLGQPTVAAKVILRSTSSSDLAASSGATTVSIYGVTGGVDLIESKALSGTNVISSTNSFTKLYSITPDIVPVGTLRFTQAITGTTFLELYANETSRTYTKIQFDPIPDSAYTMYVNYQARQIPLVNNADPLIIPDRYADVLVNNVVADLLIRQGDQKAATYVQLGADGIQRMLKEQDLLYDYTPSVRTSGTFFVDYSSPFRS